MSRNLKALGLALAAVFALSAVVASAAQAETDVLKTFPTTEHVILEAETDSEFQLFETPGGLAINCSLLSIDEATVEDGMSRIAAHPVYDHEESTCSFGALGPRRLSTAGCNYLLAGETDANGHAVLNIECEAGKEITLNGGLGCMFKVPPQTAHGVHYSNVTTEEGVERSMDVTLEFTISDLEYETEGCGYLGEADGIHEGASYSGAISLTGYEDIEGEPGTSIGLTDETIEGEEEHGFLTDPLAEAALLTAEASASTVIGLPGGTAIACSEFSFAPAASIESGVSSFTAHPVYDSEEESCTVGSLGEAKLSTTGCDYVFTEGTDESKQATVHVECEEGEEIAIGPVSGCSIAIPGEQPLRGVHFENVPTGSGTADHTVVAEMAAEDEVVFRTEGCKALGFEDGIHSGASIEGAISVVAYADEGGSEGERLGFGFYY